MNREKAIIISISFILLILLVGCTDGGVSVDITPGNSKPTASFSVQSGELCINQSISFDASGSTDSDGSISNYSWDFGDGSNGSGLTVDHIYASLGSFTITLEVTDNQGAVDSHSETIIIVNDSNFPSPTAVFSVPSDTLSWGGGVFFDGSDSIDPDNSGLEYSWDFGDTSPLAEEQNIFHCFDQSGTFTVTLEVTNGHGNTHQVSHNVQVASLNTQNGLTANAGLDQRKLIAQNDTMIYLDGSGSSTESGTITSYGWSFSSLPQGSTMSNLLIRDADTATPYIDFDQERGAPDNQGYLIYELELSVTNSAGTQVRDQVCLYLTGQGSGSLIIQ